MVSIPVRLHKAARRERIRFRHVYRPAEIPEAPESDEDVEEETPTPARQPLANKVQPFPGPVATGPAPEPETVAPVRNMPVGDLNRAPVQASQVLKGFEIEKDRYVTFTPGELAAVRAKTSTELSIAEFVRLQEIDPIFFETSYYAAPDRGGEKPYALLFAALAETDYAAIGSLAMHGREHATVIRAGRRGLILHSLFYQNEVRGDEEYPADRTLVNAKELELAKTVIRALSASFDAAKLKDTFEERLRALIDSRTETAIAAYGQGEAAKPAPVMDIMEALRKSLEMARKPPASERAKAPAARKAVKGRLRRAHS